MIWRSAPLVPTDTVLARVATELAPRATELVPEATAFRPIAVALVAVLLAPEPTDVPPSVAVEPGPTETLSVPVAVPPSTEPALAIPDAANVATRVAAMAALTLLDEDPLVRPLAISEATTQRPVVVLKTIRKILFIEWAPEE